MKPRKKVSLADETNLPRNSAAANGSELWRSQGTAANTEMVVDLEAGSGSSSPGEIRDSGAFGRGIGFTAFTTAGGTELYTTTGAVGNFDLVDQIEAGSGSSTPLEIHYSGLVAIFSAQTAAAGFEPWLIADVAGTYLTTSLGDLNPGAGSGHPQHLVAVAGRVFFSATDGSGRELWAMPLFLFDDGFESNDTAAWSFVAP